MNAAYYDRKGTARDVLQLGSVPTPQPTEGEVLVRIRASGVNPSDVKRRGLWFGDAMPFPRVIPHQDGAGVVEEVGPGGPRSRIGQRVWLFKAQWERPFGTAAEYCVVPDSNAVPLPENTTFREGACLGIPAITAHYCLSNANAASLEGRHILVTGGAGAVGYYATQLAALRGAEVITTVSTPEQALMSRAAGASHVVNRTTEDVRAAVNDLTKGAGVDLAIDVAFGVNTDTVIEVLRPGGTIATYASDQLLHPGIPFAKFLYRNARVHFALLYLAPVEALREAIGDIGNALRSGFLKHPKVLPYPISRIADAHESVERGHLNGKVVLDIEGDHSAGQAG